MIDFFLNHLGYFIVGGSSALVAFVIGRLSSAFDQHRAECRIANQRRKNDRLRMHVDIVEEALKEERSKKRSPSGIKNKTQKKVAGRPFEFGDWGKKIDKAWPDHTKTPPWSPYNASGTK